MGRWEPGARERLEQAALDLFVDVGFAQVTVPQITARAGLTTRTFFRHFADKREVLFAHEEELPELVDRLLHRAPVSLAPLQLIEYGLTVVAETRFEDHADQLRARRAVIRTDPGLQERELRKLARLADVIGTALRSRGSEDLASTMSGQVAANVLSVAVDRWLDQQPTAQVATRPLAHYVADAFVVLRSLAREEQHQSTAE